MVLAAALGFTPVLVHYLLMGVLSITVVGAFESVGAILVVAMLVVPPATAYLLTERLGRMLGLSVVFGIASAWLGYALAHWLDASIAGAMATVSGLLFAVVFLVAPQHGLLAKLVRQRRLGRGMDGGKSEECGGKQRGELHRRRRRSGGGILKPSVIANLP